MTMCLLREEWFADTRGHPDRMTLDMTVAIKIYGFFVEKNGGRKITSRAADMAITSREIIVTSAARLSLENCLLKDPWRCVPPSPVVCLDGRRVLGTQTRSI